MTSTHVAELVLQSLEHERGGLLIFKTALKCVQNEDLAAEWQRYLEHTEHHVEALVTVCDALGLDSLERTPGCEIVRHTAAALVEAMEIALANDAPDAAELVACDCVLLAETKDHANWGLIGVCAKGLHGAEARALQVAYDQVEDEEDQHLVHTKAWTRALWIQYLGFPTAVPPVDEVRHRDTSTGAERAARRAAHNHGGPAGYAKGA